MPTSISCVLPQARKRSIDVSIPSSWAMPVGYGPSTGRRSILQTELRDTSFCSQDKVARRKIHRAKESNFFRDQQQPGYAILSEAKDNTTEILL